MQLALLRTERAGLFRTGFGLSIGYDIVTQQHGGTIEVASTECQFTEFTIRLPRRDGDVAPVAKARLIA